ncbi:MAG TPA: hypothetical protein VNB06_11145 [Thermoanaerobaculia bacterium]|nr:hypothetical protein [Thermoanaerobaculia bacterium]
MKLKNGLVVEGLPDGGCLIVDESEKQSHALRPEAASVWHSLEQGTVEVGEIATATGLEAEVVEAALAELEGAGLLESEAGSSRREWLARAATVAGAAVGLKLIETVVTPSPAAAQSLPDEQDAQTDN